MVTQSIDARGLNCPMPMMKTKKGLQSLDSGEVLEVFTSDPGSMRDMDALCRTTGNKLVSSEDQDDGSYRFLIEIV